ncbi:MAG: 4Fe-4S dicluster domain-containing protein [bacterium]
MKIKKRTFSGGYCFKRFKGDSQLEVYTAEVPGEVAIPLKQGFGCEVLPLVKPGDVVKAGQIIGRDDDTISSPIHSSVNGTVNEIETVEYFNEQIRTIFITADGASDWLPLEGHCAEWSNLSNNTIEEVLYKSGVTSLGSSGIPTHYKSSLISPSEVEHIIVHHTQSDVFNESLTILLKDARFPHFIEGIEILKKIMKNARIHIAFSTTLSDWLARIGEIIKDKDSTSLYTLKPKYPQHQNEVLIPSILGKKIPPGYLPANIGVITFTIQDILHVYDAIATGKPLIERLILLAGPGFHHRPYLSVKIGTPFQNIIASRRKQDQEYRFILNSITTGKTIFDYDMPVTKTSSRIISLLEERRGDTFSFMRPGPRKDSYSNTFLSLFLPFKKSLSTNIHGERRPCISCGFCSDCCPAGLYPNLLHHYVEQEKIDEPLVKFGIFDCIECNLCTYVCPSKIPLARLLKEGKTKLVDEGFQSPRPNASTQNFKGIDALKDL